MQVCYIISDINKALAFEWTANALQKKLDIRFILLNNGNTELEKFLIESGIEVVVVSCRGKRDWPMAWCRIIKQLNAWKPDAIHCHLMQASILGLSAGIFAGVRKRIFTRHHANLHHQYHKKGVLWDRLCNYMATHIIAISDNVKNILVDMDHASPKKIILIPHGFNWESFRDRDDARVKKLREKYNLINKSPVIGCIARFTELKGIQYVIPAFNDFLKAYPESVLILANAHGDYEKNINKLLEMLPKQSYRLIDFESALGDLYHCFDLFLHVPVDAKVEAFGQTYVEALAAEVPSIFTMSGIAPEFIQDGKNALVVPFRDTRAIHNALLELWQNPETRSHLAKNGWESIREKFSLTKMILSLEELYGR
jgi:glycosyltransferase involved in cell wall biosynthesis